MISSLKASLTRGLFEFASGDFIRGGVLEPPNDNSRNDHCPYRDRKTNPHAPKSMGIRQQSESAETSLFHGARGLVVAMVQLSENSLASP